MKVTFWHNVPKIIAIKGNMLIKYANGVLKQLSTFIELWDFESYAFNLDMNNLIWKKPSIPSNLEHQGKIWCNCYSNNFKTKINYQLKNYVMEMKLVVINLKCELDNIFLVEGAIMPNVSSIKYIFKVRFPLNFP